MVVQFKASGGTWAEFLDDGNVTIPGSPADGDRMFLFAAWKNWAISCSNPDGWTPIGLQTYNAPAVTAGSGVGSVKVAAWFRDWVSGDTDPLLNFSGTGASFQAAATILLFNKDDTTQAWRPPVSRFAVADWDVTDTVTNADGNVTLMKGGVVIGFAAFRDESALMTRSTSCIADDPGVVSWTGFAVPAPSAHGSFVGGGDGCYDIAYRRIAAGFNDQDDIDLTMSGALSFQELGVAMWVVQNIDRSPFTSKPSDFSAMPKFRLRRYNT